VHHIRPIREIREIRGQKLPAKSCKKLPALCDDRGEGCSLGRTQTQRRTPLTGTRDFQKSNHQDHETADRNRALDCTAGRRSASRPRPWLVVGLMETSAVDAETSDGYVCAMRTVAEIKQAFMRLPDRQRINLARSLQTQVDDRLSDDELMKLAADGARALDRREAVVA